MLRLVQGLTVAGLAAIALPAHALDCASPQGGEDVLAATICIDPALKQADKALNDAYRSLYQGRDGQQQQVIKFLRHAWLEDGVDRCTVDKKVDGQCLLREIQAQTEFFRSADGIGPASQGKLLFKGYYAPRKGDDRPETDISLFEFETPNTAGKTTLNAAVEKILRAGKENAPDPNLDWREDLSIKINPAFQTSNFISAKVDYWSSAGVHGRQYSYYLNQFLDRSEPLAFSDMFQEYDAPILAKACYDQFVPDSGLPDATTGDSEANYRPSNTFMKAFRDPSHWHFDGKSLQLTFYTYSLGAYADGVNRCELSYDALKPHLADKVQLPVPIDQAKPAQ